MRDLRKSMDRYDPTKWQAKRYALYRSRWTGPARSTLTFDPMDPPDAIEFKVLTQGDDDADLSWLGEFTNRWEPEAIDHSVRAGRGERNAYPYWVPGYSVDDRRRDLNKMGYSRGMADYLAQTQLYADYYRHADYGNGWGMLGVTVHLYICGAYVDSQSVWGIESDAADFQEETADDLKWYLSESVEDYVFDQLNRLELLKAIRE